MKLLLAVMTSTCASKQFEEASRLFVCAWAKFAQRNRNKIPCDIIFCNHQHKHNIIDPLLQGFPIYDSRLGSYHSGIANVALENSQGYDYIILCEHDSFLSVEWLEIIYKFLEDNPELNWITTSTLRSWYGLQNSPSSSILYPWTAPQSSTGLVIIKRELYLRALQLYHSYGKNCILPLNSNTLTYGEICDILSNSCGLGLRNKKLGLDGPFSVDFFTYMCKVGISHGEIVNQDGRSLLSKTWISSLNFIERFSSFNEFVDDDQSVIPLSPNSKLVKAPYLHIGGGYGVSQYFEYLSDHHCTNLFKGLLSSVMLSHYSIIHLLTTNSGDKILIDTFTRTQEKIFNLLQIDRSQFQEKYQKVIDCYSKPLAEYL